METIKLIGTSICVTMIVTAIFFMLVPDKKPEKMLRFSISLFFLTGLISPFVGKSLNFHIDPLLESYEQQEQPLESQISESFATLAAARLERQLEDTLKSEGIIPLKITVSVHIDDSNGISIEQPKIITEEKAYQEREKIGQLTKALLGYEPLIILSDEKN